MDAASPESLVTDFLKLLEAGDVDAACDLLAVDVAYINVSLPAIHGRERVRRVFSRMMARKSAGFEVHFHKVGVDGPSVLTERTDVLIFGPVRIQIWVWGRFDVAGGQITVWKDYFDWWNVARATVRGLIGALVPPLRPKPPALS
ncbi:MAG TPA: limonene-1,2-epoxide hydrolase family protein [Acidimicrobiales bacterium]|nr:limonene-1,2-epoxide hydrolase family protein [Acidimicrobiales bacterium]